MPRYYCDYCDTYLTHDSPSVRKQHNAGYKHKANVRTYYQQFEEQQTQYLIDQRIKQHLGQAAAYQVGAPFNPLMSLAGGVPRPRPPILSAPFMPPGPPLMPGIRPPILPTPGAPGYPGAPPTILQSGAPGSMQHPGAPPGSMPQPGAPPGSMPQPGAPPGSMPQPGAPPGSMPHPGAPPGSMPHPGAPPGSMPMQMASLPRPPTLPPPTSGAPGAPIPNSGAPAAMYQTDQPQPAGPTSGAPPAPPTAPQPSFSYTQPSEDTH